MIFKVIVDQWDSHVWFRVFVGEKEDILGLAGKLCMRDYEFVIFSRKIDIIEPQWAIQKIADTLAGKIT